MAAHGIYVEKLTSGVVYGIKIEDDTKHQRSLTPSDYRAQNYQPPIEALPDIAGYLGQKTSTAQAY